MEEREEQNIIVQKRRTYISTPYNTVRLSKALSKSFTTFEKGEKMKCTMIDFAQNGVRKNDLCTMVSDVPTSERTSERSGAQRSGAEWSGAKRSGTERSGAERCGANE